MDTLALKMNWKISKSLLFLFFLTLLVCGCNPQEVKPILFVHELKLSDFAVDGLKMDLMLNTIEEKLGEPLEVIDSGNGTKLLRYQKNMLGLVNGKLNMLSGKVLFVAGIPVEEGIQFEEFSKLYGCLLYTSPSPRDQRGSRMPSSA